VGTGMTEEIKTMQKNKKLILFFKDISIKDIPLVGGKNASLGEMLCSFAQAKSQGSKSKIKIPNGFAITAYAYQYFIKENKLDKKIKKTLTGLDTHNLKDLAKRGEKTRKIILAAKIPKDLEKEIIKAYKELSSLYEKGSRNIDVAVRSSATAEDLPNASFAGQQESYLNTLFLQIGRFLTARKKSSVILKCLFQSACKKWSVRTKRRQG
jgi:pyruvate,water dikinase